CALNAARSVEIALHAAFIEGDLFVQAGVFDRYREVRGKDRKDLNVVRGEIVELGTLQVHHPNDAIFVHHRDGQFGPRFGVQHAVPRIEGYVGNSDRAAELRGRTDNPFVDWDGRFFLYALAELHGDTVTKNGSAFVVEENAENLIVDQALR